MPANLRHLKRQGRKALTPSERLSHSKQIVQQVLNSHYYQAADKVAAYLALPEEVNLHSLIETAWQDNKQLYLPVVVKKHSPLFFAPYFADTKLKKDAMQIDVPSVDKKSYINVNQLDCVITPLVAFDENCNRIGMGGGFYDRTFAQLAMPERKKTQLIGVAFEVQKVAQLLSPQIWDIALDAVISETTIYKKQV